MFASTAPLVAVGSVERTRRTGHPRAPGPCRRGRPDAHNADSGRRSPDRDVDNRWRPVRTRVSVILRGTVALEPSKRAAPRHVRTARRWPLLRNLVMVGLYETFLVSAVVSLLLIRAALALSGFPQVGGGGLHIAHMLWGGLLMLLSLRLLLGFIGRAVQFTAAIVSGIGFGTFIDEVGKFVTSDNNYFFRPAVALIYVVFVLLSLSARALEGRMPFTD